MDLVKKYYHVTENPEESDCVLIFVSGPDSGIGYSHEDAASGENGFVPISLQYRPYQAEFAREQSIAGDRSYKGKTVRTTNECDLDLILDTKELMKDKPVIVSLLLSNPVVVAEFESQMEGLLVNLGVYRIKPCWISLAGKQNLPDYSLSKCRPICGRWSSNSKMWHTIYSVIRIQQAMPTTSLMG
ncbi:hypothetical protein [Paenibacillus physcomitrellae]|nr:hypothetical protein [Paenibacillus physcomitrellae]